MGAMDEWTSADSRSSLKVGGLAAGCIFAATLTTLAAASLAEGLGVVGTVLALALMWVIAVVEIAVWLRWSSPRSLGLIRLGPRDAAFAMVAGVVLAFLVPLLSLGAARLLGVATNTLETAAQLNVGIAVLGVLTAAVTEEIVFRAAAMSALVAVRAPTLVVLGLPALLFTSIHWSWGFAHMAFVVFPISLALGALFLWRRSILVNVIAHLLADLPLVVLAAVGS